MKYSLKVSGIALNHLTADAWYYRVNRRAWRQSRGASRDFQRQIIQDSVIDWLCWEIGPSIGSNAKWEYEFMGELLYFKREEDKVKFILKWL